MANEDFGRRSRCRTNNSQGVVKIGFDRQKHGAAGDTARSGAGLLMISIKLAVKVAVRNREARLGAGLFKRTSALSKYFRRAWRGQQRGCKQLCQPSLEAGSN